MRKRYYKRNRDEGDEVFGVVIGILVIIGGFLFSIYRTDKVEFWHIILWYVAPFLIALILIAFFLIRFKEGKRKNLESIVDSIINDPVLNQTVEKFIGSFGRSKHKYAWKAREYSFDSGYLNDFAQALKEKDFKISTENNNADIKEILRRYIDQKDKNYLEQTLATKESHSFSEFKNDGIDFENLIVRLYTAMGYESKRIGGSGDQGGDVIAAKNGENILIQAKFYEGSVSNTAVQQAVAARVHYACSSAQVITTSTFTRGAIELAKSNDVKTIDGQELSRLLVTFLKEDWQ